MSEKIEPALSAQEWAVAIDQDALDDVRVGRDVIAYLREQVPSVPDSRVAYVALEEGNAIGKIRQPAKLIAILNAALPGSDPKKITRAMVDALRKIIKAAEDEERFGGQLFADVDDLDQIADALESYLPPEK